MRPQATVLVVLTCCLAALFCGCKTSASVETASDPNACNARVCMQAANAAGDSGSGERPAAAVRMTDDRKYVPDTVRIRVGQTVRWDNASAMVHTVTCDPALAQDRAHVELPAGAAPFTSGNIAPGRAYSRTFTVPGRYRYFCIPHEQAGMVGEVTVQE